MSGGEIVDNNALNWAVKWAVHNEVSNTVADAMERTTYGPLDRTLWGIKSDSAYQTVDWAICRALNLVYEVVETMEWVVEVAVEDVVPTDWNVWDDV